MSDGLLRLVGGCLAALDFLENLIKLLKNGLRQKFFVLPYCFLETQPTNHLSYNKSVEKMAYTVNFGCKNVIRMVLNMENNRNYEKQGKF